MKRILSIGICVAVVCSLSSCHEELSESQVATSSSVREGKISNQTDLSIVTTQELKAKKAEFTFETKLRKVLTKPETKIVLVEYPFQNNTNETIEIVEYDAPCTCMGARLRRPDGKQSFVFKPGDRGVVIGKLDFENFSGTIDKKIWIRTSMDKQGEPSIVLTARVTIPTLIGPDKPALKWELGSALTPQVFHIKVDHKEPINILRHSLGFGADEYFSYQIETVKVGKEYKVTVTPKKTDALTLGVLRFYTDNKLARYKLVQVYLSVSKKQQARTQ